MEQRATTTEALLTWAYQRELVAAISGTAGLWDLEAGGPGSGIDSVLSVARAAQLGAIIRSTGGGFAAIQDAPPDALAVHQLLHDILPKPHRMAVVHFATRGTRPDVGGLPALIPAEMKPTAWGERPVYDFDQGYRKGAHPWLCQLRLDPEPRECLAQRALYRTWREGLRIVMVQLRLRPQSLASWAVSEALPPEAPPLPAWVERLLPQAAARPERFSYVGVRKAS